MRWSSSRASAWAPCSRSRGGRRWPWRLVAVLGLAGWRALAPARGGWRAVVGRGLVAVLLAGAALAYASGVMAGAGEARPGDLDPAMKSYATAAVGVVSASILFALQEWSARGRGIALPGVVCGLGIAALLGIAAMDPGPTMQAGNPQNVLLVVVDTLRSDRTELPVGDGLRERTPHLAQLASRGTRYASAYSQAPWTMPSTASMMTGEYPGQHGAYSLTGRLSAPVPVLAEILRESGYQTAAVVSHGFVSKGVGFGQGFDAFDDALVIGKNTHRERSSGKVTDRALKWLGSRDADAPFFLWLHYFDPHYEYLDNPDWPWADDYDGWLKTTPHEIAGLRVQRHRLGPDDLGWLSDLYDEEIAYTDREIGRLIDALGQQGLLDDTVVIFVSDHGEAFGEHGWIGHTLTVHEELVHVPLFWYAPGGQSLTIASVVETRSLFWSLMDHLGIAWQPDSPSRRPLPTREEPDAYAVSGVSLLDAPLMSGKTSVQTSIRTNDATLIVDRLRGSEAYYDRSADLDENAPLAADEGAAALRARLADWEQRFPTTEAATREIDAEEIELLKELGYL
ncbi:MAG: sulfatase [Alphaproteobacteria bacterium]|nr:sulfatase [Alphaproteobacteria bacterium]